MKNTVVISNDEMFSEVTRLLSDGHSVTINVKGRSMLPLIVGERDTVELAQFPSYKKDDIVLFYLGNRWILHRILEVRGDTALIRGDGIYKYMEVCPVPNIKGKVTYIFHKGVKRIDPYSKWSIAKLRVWNFLHPFRRYILYAWRHMPWMLKYFKHDINNEN